MNNMLIHIGFHKTGTTWLQKNLFTRNSDYFFPISDQLEGPSALAMKLIYDEDQYLLNSFCDNKNVIQQNLRQILKSDGYNPEKIAVISHERLSGNPHSSGFDGAVIARRIKNNFPKAKILIGIREQSTWLLSNYFQYLKVGGNLSLSNYLNTKYDGKRPAFSQGHLEYHYLIKDYQDRFSKENVLVVPYELFDSDHSLFLKLIGNFLHIDLSGAQLDFDQKENISSDYFLNYKLRFLNRFRHSNSLNNYSPYSTAISRKIVYHGKELLSTMISNNRDERTKEQLLQKITAWTKDRFAQSNKSTSELTGLDLEMFGYQMENKSQ